MNDEIERPTADGTERPPAAADAAETPALAAPGTLATPGAPGTPTLAAPAVDTPALAAPAAPSPATPTTPNAAPSPAPTLTAPAVAARAAAVLTAVGQIVLDMDEPLRVALASILAGGHVLFEDVPGLGKTLAARSLARALGLGFRRLQCTPDLLPADITGSYVYVPATGEFVFREGPVFTGLLLADEINRTAPKTQSALLEAMAEGQVSVEGTSFRLPAPFHVLATSNPIEFEGTYALPEAQLDRFLVRLSVGYPDQAHERQVLLSRVARRHEAAEVAQVLAPGELATMQAGTESVHVDEDVAGYCVALAAATRAHPSVSVGASPRGSQALMLVGRAMAVLDGRDFVTPEDVKRIAVAALAHRLSLTPAAWAAGSDPRAIVADVVTNVAVPPTVGARG